MKMASMPTVYRIEVSWGVATNATNRSRTVIVRVRLDADATFMITGPAPVCAVRLFSWASRSSVSLAMKSTIWASTASEALKDTALRTLPPTFAPLGAAPVGGARQGGRGVVGALLLEGPADVSPRGGYRGCRADVGARRHRSKVGGGQNERAGGCSARPFGCHVH